MGYSVKRLFIKTILPIIIGIVVGVIARETLLTKATVVGDSMQPTMYDGDMCLVNRVGGLKRGDIVVVKQEEDYIIKRLVGLPHDTIQIIDGKLFVNDNYVEENYIKDSGSGEEGYLGERFILGTNDYFVLGDNRANSKDSRYIGPIQKEEILGYVIGGNN